MSYRAWTYVWAVLLVAAVVSGLALPGLAQSQPQWLTFAVLTLLASLAQLWEAEAPARQSYYPTMIPLFAGVVLLHPFLFVLLVAIPHLLEWAKARLVNSPHLRNWYLQPFNIATHIISGLAACWVYTTFGADMATFATVSSVLAIATAALTYLILNHFLVGQALVLARGISWRESGIMAVENLLSDLVMLCLGATVAVLWTLNPSLILLALVPLLLIYRALSVPRLKKEAQTDDKTGLWNARHFVELSSGELERAKRFNRPAALLLADLDLLRNINNHYGHLAGDIVLAGLGQTIREHIREYDIAGRFGGEEFCIFMPEAQPAHARSFAERLRKALEDASFEVRTSPTPIRATMSLGVACFPEDGTTIEELIQQADTAMYQAKLRGRNCVVCASELPHFVKAGTPSLEKRYAPSVAEVLTAGREPEDVSAMPDADPPPIPVVEREDRPRLERGAGEHPRSLVPLYVGAVIAAGAGATIVGSSLFRPSDLVTIGLLTLLAVMAELFEVNLYGSTTMSVSVAVNFAAALVTGIPGVACVSGAIALVHWFKNRPAFYRTAFNWATHVFAGLAPVVAIGVLDMPLEVSNLLLLAIPAAVAALVYYLIDTGLIAVAISLSEEISIRGAWRMHFRWLAEHYMVLCILGLLIGVAHVALGLAGTIVFALPVLMMHYSQKQYVERTEHSVRELRRMNQELTLANREISAASETMQRVNDELFLSFAKVIEARDPYVSGHSAKVADYATAIAIELGLPSDRVQDIRQAAFLHDIGKIGISEDILRKPGRLSAEEQAQVKSHAALGAELLETCRGLRHLASIVKHHHERWDGSGYPDGLAGEQTPLEARILAVCDAVEAMASDRPYRRAMMLSEIVAEVERCTGTQFDPVLAEAFARFASRFGEDLVINSAEEAMRRPAETDARILQKLEVGRAYLTV